MKSSLEYENLKSEIGDVILENVASNTEVVQNADEVMPYLENYCKTHKSYAISSDDAGFGIDISCESVKKGQQATVEEMVSESVDQFYYKDYDCGFVDCLNQDQKFYLISEDFKEYLTNKFYLVSLVLLALFGLMILLTQHKANAFLIAGILVIVASLPFMALKSILFFLQDYFYGIARIFFANSSSAFVGMIIIGIILLIAGVIWKLVSIGFKVSHFFSKNRDEEDKEAVSKKEIKDIVKKEISKEKREIRQSKKPVSSSKSKK